MNIVLGRTVCFDFVCHTVAGVVSDADGTPTVEVFEEDTDTTVYALTAVKRTAKTGNYRVPVACTAANGFEIGKSYNVVASATVGGTASKAVIGTFLIENIALKCGAIVADGSNTSSTFKTDLSESDTDYHKDALIVFTSGSLINQVKKVSAYNGSTKFITVSSAFTGTPSASDTFILLVY
jgi:hypothetical protein